MLKRLSKVTRNTIARITDNPILRRRIGPVHVEAGWFRGERMRLAQLIICEKIDDGALIVLNLSVLKFGLEIDLESRG